MKDGEFTLDRHHVIIVNDEGQRKRVNNEEWNDFQENPSVEHPFYGFKYDLNSYLNHGFTEINEAFDKIENN